MASGAIASFSTKPPPSVSRYPNICATGGIWVVTHVLLALLAYPRVSYHWFGASPRSCVVPALLAVEVDCKVERDAIAHPMQQELKFGAELECADFELVKRRHRQ